HTLQRMKANGEKISMITAYDYSFARIFDAAGIDVILVGDSASNVMAGHETTLPITLDQMIYHASSVMRGVNRAFVVVDLPFGSYQSNSKEALASAIRIMKETGAHGVKIEGGEEILESVNRILAAGIPIIGHLGLTPQSIYKFGTYSVRAKEEAEAEKLKRDAHLLQDAEFIDTLGGKAEMADDGNACGEDAVHRFEDLFTAFDLDAMGAGLLHDADGRGQRLFGIGLVRAKGEIDNHERAVDTSHHRRGVIDHLVEGDGQGGLMPGHDIGGRIAHENNVDACRVEDPGKGVVVGGDHGDLFAVGLHPLQRMGRYFFDLGVD